MQIDVITLFPEMLDGFLGQSMMKRAAKARHVIFNFINLRDFAGDKHRTTDERPFGGGPGMVMKPEPIFKAVESIRTEKSRVILMCPQGRPFTQKRAQELGIADGDVLEIAPFGREGAQSQRIKAKLTQAPKV